MRCILIHFVDHFPDEIEKLAKLAAESSLPTHASRQCRSACRYFAIVLAGLMHGLERDEVLSADWEPLRRLQECEPLHPEIDAVAAGSFRELQPPAIQGSGYVVKSLEAALWAFHDAHDFREAVLRAVNLGDDTEDFDWDVTTTLWEYNGGGLTDYSVWDTFFAVSVDELTGSFQYFVNLEDDTDEDTGMALGLKYGEGGGAGKSQVFGSFYDFDGNASVWAVGQDDVPIAPDPVVGLCGFGAGWTYWWPDAVTLKVGALPGADDTDDPWRLGFDIDVNLAR